MPRPIGNGMEWSNEKTLHFLELLAAETVIWDPKHKHHKVKQKVNEAWLRLEAEMNHPVEYLKHKKKSLMASFRPLVNKKKASLQSMLTDDDVFQPSWFAYEAMESFLGPLYFEDENEANTSQDADVSNDNKVFAKPCRRVVDVKFEPYTDTTSREMKDTINNVLKRQRSDEEDECDWYGKLLAKKLRKLPENERAIFMYEIDGMFVNRLRNLSPSSTSQNTPQRADFSRHIAMNATNNADRAECVCQGEREQQVEDHGKQQIEEHIVATTADHLDYYKKY